MDLMLMHGSGSGPRLTFDPQTLCLISPAFILIMTLLPWSLTHLQFNFTPSLTEGYFSTVLTVVSIYTLWRHVITRNKCV